MARITDQGLLVWVIPYALNLPQILQQNPPKNFRPIADQFYLILDYLCSQMEFEDLDETDGFVMLNAHKLQRYNKHYEKYLKFLKKCGVLKSDNFFEVGRKSRGYRIKPLYLSDQSQEIPVLKPTLKEKVHQDLNTREKKQANISEQYYYLTKWFNSNLQIDIAAAKAEVVKIYFIPKLEGVIRGLFKGRGKLNFKRYKAYLSIERIARKDFYYSVDETAGRFHSNLTNLKKDLRKYLTYEGKPLAIVDIANAQPLFSSVLLKPEFYSGAMELNFGKISSLSPLFSNSSQTTSLSSFLLPYIILQLFSETHESQAYSSFQEFCHSVQEGTFYKLAHEKMFPGEEFQKKKVKEAVFATFFSHNKFIGQVDAKPKKLFAEAFPEVYSVFKYIKKGNHALLAQLLQRIESYIMVETVARRIAQERPELPIYTIHDGIATLKGEETYVKRVIKEEILRLTGLYCTITLED